MNTSLPSSVPAPAEAEVNAHGYAVKFDSDRPINAWCVHFLKDDDGALAGGFTSADAARTWAMTRTFRGSPSPAAPTVLDLSTPEAAFIYLESIGSPTVEIAGFGDQLSPVDDAIRAITGESSNTFASAHNCWMWSTTELLRVLAEYSVPAAPCPSASHLPLVPPVGVSGQTLKEDVLSLAETIWKAGESAPVSPSLPAPSVRYFASGLIGKPGEYTVDIMREVTHEGSVTTGLYACLECTRMPDDLLAEADHLVARLNTPMSQVVTLKADVERLTGEKEEIVRLGRELLGRMDRGARFDEQLSSFVPASRFVEEFRSALSLAEVGRKAEPIIPMPARLLLTKWANTAGECLNGGGVLAGREGCACSRCVRVRETRALLA